jgi:hypothetical protein
MCWPSRAILSLGTLSLGTLPGPLFLHQWSHKLPTTAAVWSSAAVCAAPLGSGVCPLRTPLPYPAVVRFLRRNTAPAQTTDQATSADGSDGSPGGSATATGKGRPTPKRREAEGRRRGPVAPPPRTQREAFRRGRGTKEERRAERIERRERMLAGDERYLLPRDRGQVRAYVRDLVDSRRHAMGLFMPLALLVFVSLFVRSALVQSVISTLTLAMLAVVIVETAFLGRYVTKRVRQKFPNAKDSAASLTFYAFGRASTLRRLRSPRPRVRPGDAVA